MSNLSYRIDQVALSPRVIEVETREEPPSSFAAPPPQVIATDRSGPVVPTERALATISAEPVRRRDRVVTFGMAGIAVLLVGWAAVDAAAWISTAFDHGAALGVLAAAAVVAGVGGAGAIILREAVLMALVGTILGIGMSYGAKWVLQTLVPASFPPAVDPAWWPAVARPLRQRLHAHPGA